MCLKLIALLLAFGLVPATAISMMALAQSDRVQTLLSQRLADNAVAINDTIDRNLFERYGDVQAFGTNVAEHTSTNWRRPGSDNPLVRVMNDYIAAYGVYKMSVLVGPAGDVLAVNTADAGGKPLETNWIYRQSFAMETWFSKAMKGEFLEGKNGFTGTVVEQPAISPLVAKVFGDDGYTMVFAAPVKDQHGTLVGVWANFASFDLVEQIVSASYRRLAKDGMPATEIIVIDPAGVVLADHDPSVDGTGSHRRNFEIVGKLNLVARGSVSATAVARGETGTEVAIHSRKQVEQANGYAHSVGAYDFPGLGRVSV